MFRNIALEPEPISTSDEIMEILQQFGYITFFGTIFPLGAALCLIFNIIQYFCILQEFAIRRRGMPRVTLGIGTFLWYLDLISHLSILVNCAIVYFTAKAYRETFIGPDNWFADRATFILVVVLVEHVVIGIKLILSMFIGGDDPRILFKKERKVNSLIIAQHEAAQSMVLEKRIKNGDKNAVLLKNKFARLDEDDIKILENRAEDV